MFDTLVGLGAGLIQEELEVFAEGLQ